MKKAIKILLLSFLLAIFTSFLFGCGTSRQIAFTFVYNNGQEDMTVHTAGIYIPETPLRDGYEFAGWYDDAELTSLYNFSSIPDSDVTLYASWRRDYRELSNDISDFAVNGCVSILSEFYHSAFAIFPSYQSQGSGAIYQERDGYYYILTNYHVIANDNTYEYIDYTVYDAYANEYKASLVAAEKEYDLAVLAIRKSNECDLSVLEISQTPEKIGNDVIAIGAPEGKLNTYKFGKLSAYKEIKKENIKNGAPDLTFPLIWHTAYASHGSSGGPLINTDLKIIGINYAVASDSEGEFLYCFSIPSEKINEFLNKAGLQVK